MTVLENLIMAPINLHGVSRSQAVQLAEELLAKVGLSDKRDAWPSSLSGGQQGGHRPRAGDEAFHYAV